ncbi:MAG: SGNH/GDSL hydrolase family protein [Myxococcales bacterium]|nr:SGNH/GDSL hydrolase family protein [Myxococcales bacterium]
MRFRDLAPLGLTACFILPACAGDDTGGGSASAGESETSNASETGSGGSGSTSGAGSASGASDSATSGSTSGSTSGAGSTSSDTTGSTTGNTSDTTGTTAVTGNTTDPTGGTTGGELASDCLFQDFVNQGALVIDYDQYAPVIGSHCKGTNHQEITDIERVVFLGDSVTVGTPPTLAQDFYRAQLADALVDRFGLTPPSPLWKQANPIDGVALQKESGDFASCAKWGAETNDFIKDNDQIIDCLPEDMWDKRTLVIITMGGNDLAGIAKDGANGKALDEVYADVEATLTQMREAVEWMVSDPNKFPNGIFVVFANVYEFTDGTADVTSCPAAGLGGFDKPWENPDELKALMIYLNEEYMKIAVDTQTDMIFLLETFCGHGFNADDPTAPCYRGPDQKTLFDLTCIHPTPAGHGVITDLFTSVVDE